MQIKILLILILAILSSVAYAQTWPTKDCPDKPYTKGNDGIIYHTCDCGIGRVADSLFYFGIDSIGTLRDMKKGSDCHCVPLKHKARSLIWDKGFFARDKTYRNGKLIKNTPHYDSLACPFCGRILPKIHIKVRIDAGLLYDKLDKDGQFVMTPLGKYDLIDPYWRDDPKSLPANLMAYLPKDFWKKKTKYIDDLNDWTK